MGRERFRQALKSDNGSMLLRTLKRRLGDATLWLLAAALLLWCGDWAVWHLRVRRGTAYSSVQVTQLLLTPLKNHRMKAEEQGTLDQPCVRALFPHSGENPCWWLRRHATQSQSASRMGAAETRAVSAAIYHLVISNSDMYRFNCLRPHQLQPSRYRLSAQLQKTRNYWQDMATPEK